MRLTQSFGSVSALFLSLALLAGCSSGTASGGTSTTTSPAVAALQTGNWQLAVASQLSPGTSYGISVYISQSNGTVTGLAHFDNSPCYSYATNVTLTGTQDTKGNLSLTSGAVNGQTLTATGVVTGNGTQFTAAYAITGGCAGTDKGTIGGFVIPDISGTYKGTIVSKTGVQIATTAQINQTSVDTNGFFHFTAAATFTGSPCLTTASLTTTGTSTLNGNALFGILTTPGTPSTQISLGGLVNSTNGAPPTGLLISSYSVSGGLCSGDTGSGQLTRQ